MEQTLTYLLCQRGSIPAVRVSSARAHGAAKRFSYWGAVRYRLRLSKRGIPTFTAEECAGSDRRSPTKAMDDAITIAWEEGRIYLGLNPGPVPRSSYERVLRAIETFDAQTDTRPNTEAGFENRL